MTFRGAGGTNGGVGRFILGVVMILAGFYLLLTSIQVVNPFNMGYGLYNFGGMRITSGMVLVPFIFGVGFIFYDAKNAIGWILAAGSFFMLVIGVLTSLQFRFGIMSAFDLLIILVLLFGGIGLFLSSLRPKS